MELIVQPVLVHRAADIPPVFPSPTLEPWARQEWAMDGFPGLGQGQGWSAATLPLSSQAPAPSLYLRSQNHIHGALGALWARPTACNTQGRMARKDSEVMHRYFSYHYESILRQRNAVNWCSVFKLKSTWELTHTHSHYICAVVGHQLGFSVDLAFTGHKGIH